MINLKRVAKEIKDIGFYNLILEDVKRALNKENPTYEDIENLLKSNSDILEAYKQLNVEYNLSNIHIKEIDIDKLDPKCKERAKEFNSNLKILKNIEKYTLDFAQSSVLVIIFSIEFFVLFSVQYLIVLLNLKDWQIEIYTFFALSILIAWWYAKKEKRKFQQEKKRFENIYNYNLNLLKQMEDLGCIKREDLFIDESSDHI